MSVTKVTLAAATYTSLEAVCDALGGDEFKILSALTDLEVGLVTGGETPSALPEVEGAGLAVKIIKPNETTLELWAESTAGGDIYVHAGGSEYIIDVTGTTSA
jgi:hypothetical protein